MTPGSELMLDDHAAAPELDLADSVAEVVAVQEPAHHDPAATVAIPHDVAAAAMAGDLAAGREATVEESSADEFFFEQPAGQDGAVDEAVVEEPAPAHDVATETIETLDDYSEPAPASVELEEQPEEPFFEEPVVGTGGGALGTLIGVSFGGLVGIAAGLVLLAVSQPGGLIEQLRHPVRLWQSIDDPVLKLSAVLVAAGFLLLGYSTGRRTPPSAP